MDKKELKRRPYVSPFVEVIKVKADSRILAGSPAVQPGGGGGGSVSIEDPVEDDEDTEISGAKKFNLWEGGDD
ncbi:MAG: hypothetical protein MR681_08810 [Prevotella sp.]|nr:hypothetical protein [Prevotella sp.]